MSHSPGGMPELLIQREAEEEQKMTPKLEAFFKEFHFLKPGFSDLPIAQCRVSRIDEELLLLPAVRYATYWRGYSRFFFYDEKGEFKSGQGLTLRRFFGPQFDLLKVGDILNEAKAYAHYIAWYQQMPYDAHVLVLYKPPKNFTIETWVAKLVHDSTNEFRQSIAQIDRAA